MLFKISSHTIFIGKSEFENLESKVLDGRTRYDFAKELYGNDVSWGMVRQEVMNMIYGKIKIYLFELYQNSKITFLTKYERFKYTSEEAEYNFIDLLHAYTSKNKNAFLHLLQNPDIDCVFIEEGFGAIDFKLVPIKATLYFNTKEKSWLQRLVDDRWDVSLDISSHLVRGIYGNLDSFLVAFDGFILHFKENISMQITPTLSKDSLKEYITIYSDYV